MTSRLATVLVVALASMLAAADWPQFMGPARNGHSDETGLARSWPAGGPPELWRIDMGKGFGGAAVVGSQVYILDREGEQKDLLRCLDLATGKELWQVGYDAPGKFSYTGPRAVPTIVGDKAVCSGPLGDLVCIDTTTRKILWRHHTWRDFGGKKPPMWAFAQNPLVLGNLVIIHAQAPQAGMVAYDLQSGDVRWKSQPLGGRAGYVSPALLRVGDALQLVAVTAGPSSRRPRGQEAPATPPAPKPTVFGLDPATGKLLWSYLGWQCETPASLPLDLGQGRLLVTGGYRSGAAIIQVTAKGDGTFEASEALRTKSTGSHVHMPIVVDGYIYANGTTNHRKDGLTCTRIDGQLAWKTGREPAFDKGGLLFADGMLISVDGKQGILRLIQPNPDKFTVLAEAKVLDPPQCWAPLALANGHLLIRDQKQLKCLDLRAR